MGKEKRKAFLRTAETMELLKMYRCGKIPSMLNSELAFFGLVELVLECTQS